MSSSSPWPPVLAPADSLLGGLQRGRGEGPRALLEETDSDVGELVRACVAVDPRYDSQLDSRDDYYARLAQRSGPGVAEIEQLVVEAERDAPEIDPGQSLALGVLTRMAAMDSPEAVDAIRRYVTWGRYWIDAVTGLASDYWSGDPRPDWRDRVEGLGELVSRRFPSVEAMSDEIFSDWIVTRCEPWVTWAADFPVMAGAIDTLRVKPTPMRDFERRLDEASTEQLLACADCSALRSVARRLVNRTQDRDLRLMLQVASEAGAPMQVPALNALALQGHIEVLPAIQLLLDQERPGQRRALMVRAFAALPYAATRPIALTWLPADNTNRRAIASRLIGEHSVAADVELAASELTVELNADLDGNQYVICSLAQALGRHPDHGPHPELERAYHEMPYSYGRHFVVDAIQATDPRFSDHRAIDCLWDAEPQIRTAAARHASRNNPTATRRLHELASDPHEDPKIRNHAA
jgi:hypothetical protein